MIGVNLDHLNSSERRDLYNAREEHKNIANYVARCFKGMLILYGALANQKLRDFTVKKMVCIIFIKFNLFYKYYIFEDFEKRKESSETKSCSNGIY